MILKFRIRADKSGHRPLLGTWPMLGVELGDYLDPTRVLTLEDLSQIEISSGFVKFNLSRTLANGKPWLVLENARRVTRPSQPNPVEANGSADVAPEHWAATGREAPHDYLHADYVVMETLSHGTLRYRVDYQPDKYVDSDDPTEQVTIDHYAAGNTRVDAFYRLSLEG